MQKDSPQLIVDVTQLVHWPGKLTGIPRVINELAQRFAREPDTRFAVWVKDLQEMCEIDFPRTIAHRGQGIVYLRPGESATPLIASEAVPTPNQKAVAQLRKQAIRLAKGGLRRTARFSPTLSRRLESRAKNLRLKNIKRVDPRKSDILFIPWGEWWDEDFTACLLRHQKAGVRLVHIVHDIATTTQPQFYEHVKVNPTTYNAKILPVASLVLVVSQNTKRELTYWLKQSKLHIPPIEVIRNGDDINIAKPQVPQEESFQAAKLKGGDYLLCVGTIEAKKNHALFYYVYKLAKARGIKLPKLAIVGRRGWGTNDIYEIMTSDPEVHDQFVFLHNVSDAELAWLYDHCLFTILPSFHEGWGIPIAESVARGIPCLCSNTSSMVEIAPTIVRHFSPTSSDECLAAIQKWLDPKQLAKARERTKHYHPTTWDDTFKLINTYLKEL